MSPRSMCSCLSSSGTGSLSKQRRLLGRSLARSSVHRCPALSLPLDLFRSLSLFLCLKLDSLAPRAFPAPLASPVSGLSCPLPPSSLPPLSSANPSFSKPSRSSRVSPSCSTLPEVPVSWLHYSSGTGSAGDVLFDTGTGAWLISPSSSKRSGPCCTAYALLDEWPKTWESQGILCWPTKTPTVHQHI